MPRLVMHLRLTRPMFAPRAPLVAFVLALAACVLLLAPLDCALHSRAVSSLSDPLLVAFLAAYVAAAFATMALLVLWTQRPRHRSADRLPTTQPLH